MVKFTEQTQKTQSDTVPVIDSKEGDKTRDLRSRHWFLTWNNPPDEGEEILKNLHAKKHAFQLERGEEGTPHIQGVFCFKNAKKWSHLNRKVKGYWRPCRNIHAAKIYCTKLLTREVNSNPCVKGFEIPKAKKPVKDPMEGLTLKDWQQEIIKIISQEPDKRKIYWYWSSEGATGKSSFCKHLVLKHKALFCGGKAADAKYAILQYLEKNGEGPPIVCLDIPRVNKNGWCVQAMEAIKNGLLFSGKYESCMAVFNPPHIIVFANFPPKEEDLSKDRWVIKCIGKKPLKDSEIEDWYHKFSK